MQRLLTRYLEEFFLHIQINTLNLPYTKLPRPRKASVISKLLRKVFEKRSIHKLFGLQLLTAMVIIPVVSQVNAVEYVEPEFAVVSPEIVTTDSMAPITTKTREFVVPVGQLKSVSQRFHRGHEAYDITAPLGSSILAFSAGRVHYVENGRWGLGRHIVIDHGHGLYSLYAHLDTFSVSLGDFVEPGQQIGTVGMTGYTTGPHVHFEVHDNGVKVNPGQYLKL